VHDTRGGGKERLGCSTLRLFDGEGPLHFAASAADAAGGTTVAAYAAVCRCSGVWRSHWSQSNNSNLNEGMKQHLHACQ
jgi:hypothetical protein